MLHKELLVLHYQYVAVGKRFLDLSARLALAFQLIAYLKCDHQVCGLARIEVPVDVIRFIDAQHLISVVGQLFGCRV